MHEFDYIGAVADSTAVLESLGWVLYDEDMYTEVWEMPETGYWFQIAVDNRAVIASNGI